MRTRYADSTLVNAIERYAQPLGGTMSDYDQIIKAARGKQIVMLGEATHGTKEFYAARSEITMRLIEEEGFDAVAVEADWPDAYNVNRYVYGLDKYATPEQALADFERFPVWMWRNTEVLKFIQWLQAYNQQFRIPHPLKMRPVGFYGLDLYSMYASIQAVIAYLDKVDPISAQQARMRYSCLDQFMSSPQTYGYAAELGVIKSCEKEIILQLIELRYKAYQYMSLDGFAGEDEYFCAEQNAKLILNAEEYYRSTFIGRPNSWNVRDHHMFETIEGLIKHLGRQVGRPAKIVVWAHNSHIGNAAATEMSKRGELNVGQMVRRIYGKKSLLVGFSTSLGTVTASSDWDSATERKTLKEPISGSYEKAFHSINYKNFLINLTENNEAIDLLMESKLQRAVGVIYRPESERQSHYGYACLPEQFDFMLHYDETNAVTPLEANVAWRHGELADTFPFGV